jgi:hypothetical protein
MSLIRYHSSFVVVSSRVAVSFLATGVAKQARGTRSEEKISSVGASERSDAPAGLEFFIIALFPGFAFGFTLG